MRLHAVLEERARLSRAVHDGVLQVLAMVQRRTQDSEEYADLARMAGEQEASLRTLVQYDARAAAAPLASGPAAEADLVHALERVAVGHSVSGPGAPVTMPVAVVE